MKGSWNGEGWLSRALRDQVLYFWNILCSVGVRKSVSQGPPRQSSQHKGDLFAPERQRAGHKSQRREIEDKREVERNKRWGKRIFVQEGQRAASGEKGDS